MLNVRAHQRRVEWLKKEIAQEEEQITDALSFVCHLCYRGMAYFLNIDEARDIHGYGKSDCPMCTMTDVERDPMLVSNTVVKEELSLVGRIRELACDRARTHDERQMLLRLANLIVDEGVESLKPFLDQKEHELREQLAWRE